MAVSNKKKRQLKRGYPKKSITELASELGLKEAQVREALKELGLLAETRTRLRPDAGLGGNSVSGSCCRSSWPC